MNADRVSRGVGVVRELLGLAGDIVATWQVAPEAVERVDEILLQPLRTTVVSVRERLAVEREAAERARAAEES